MEIPNGGDWSIGTEGLRLSGDLPASGDVSYLKPVEITFHDQANPHCTEVGRLYLQDGTLCFTGNVDKSARLFFDAVKDLFAQDQF